ncbi:MAG: DedA family protein [Clostridiales bacterium]|nr:DedA family protein [Clostridiales bacterium]
MEEIIIQMINQFGYIGIIVLIALENIFPPIPSEVILTFGGFLTTYTKLNIWGVIFAATIGSVIGAVVLYFAGRLLNRERLLKFIEGKPGKWLRFKREDVELTLDWFSKKGTKAVFFCRCIPILRSLISIPAGMSGMAMGPFMAMTVAGTIVWNVVLVHLGAFAGASWGIITKYMDTYKNWTVLIFAALVMAGAVIFLKKRRKKRAK